MIEFTNVMVQIDGVNINNLKSLSDLDYLEKQLENQGIRVGFFGTDLAVMGSGDICTVDGSKGSTFALASGLLNYTQAVTHRLMTDRGYHPEYPELGVPWSRFVGKTFRNPALAMANLRSEIQNELYKDYRTGRVNSINVKRVDIGVYSIEISVSPAGLNSNISIFLDNN